MSAEGDLFISLKHDTAIWSDALNIIEQKMVEGQTIVVDACFSREDSFQDIKKLSEVYRYRILVVDFTDVSIEDVKFRNQFRGHAKVHEETIDKQYSRFAYQKVPKYCKVIKPYEFAEYVTAKVFDFNQWKRVHIFGDLQGSMAPLTQYLEFEGGIKEDEFYLFTGDLFDRGTENLAVANFFYENIDKPNFLVLASNHGRWFNLWGMEKDEFIFSEEFKKKTVYDFVLGDFSRDKARKIIRKEGQYALFDYRGNKFFVNHGGLPRISLNTLFRVPVRTLEKGVGGYGEGLGINTQNWNDNMPKDWYQVHGHRSNPDEPVQVGRVFRLEGEVEFNGKLHIARLENDGSMNVLSIQNTKGRNRKPDNWDDIPGGPAMTLADVKTLEDLIVLMRGNSDIYERRSGSISSFNFKKHVFHEKTWDDTNVMARGFFVKTTECEKPYIVCRNGKKVFNLNEREETRMFSLKKNLKFPLFGFHKLNGFLGLLGYDEEENMPIFCSKSTIDGEFSEMFKDIFMKNHGNKLEAVKSLLKEENLSLSFEVIDPVRDPHIIEYPRPMVVLIKAYKRTLEEVEVPYSRLVEIAEIIGCVVKKLEFTFDDFEKFEKFVESKYDGGYEGLFFQDSSGFEFKYKFGSYNRWKHYRSIKERLAMGSPINLGRLVDVESNEFYGFCRNTFKTDTIEGRKKLSDMSIIELRKQFLSIK